MELEEFNIEDSVICIDDSKINIIDDIQISKYGLTKNKEYILRRANSENLFYIENDCGCDILMNCKDLSLNFMKKDKWLIKIRKEKIIKIQNV